MEHKRFGNTVIARLDCGEEILSSLKAITLAENIKLASISALGAVSEFSAGAYDIGKKEFIPKDFAGNYEIISLIGTVNTMDGEYYSHIHICAANTDCLAVGGHLTRGIISNTCEMVITIIEGIVDRKREESTGINKLAF